LLGRHHWLSRLHGLILLFKVSAGKIVRHSPQTFLKISAAMLPCSPQSASVARASCGKEGPFRKPRDCGRGAFAFLHAEHEPLAAKPRPRRLANANDGRRSCHREATHSTGACPATQNGLTFHIQPIVPA
jgi:hypothetical protein